ncbi:RNA polymerase II transcription factor B subunit 4, partial [Dispira simplex]
INTSHSSLLVLVWESSSESPSLLAVILDINPLPWSNAQLPFENALKQTLIFLNAYLALKHDNQLVVLATTPRGCYFLYPPVTDKTGQETASTTEDGPNGISLATISIAQDGNLYQRFKLVDEEILTRVRVILQREKEMMQSPLTNTVMMTGALSRALCYINRYSRGDTLSQTQARILALSVSADSSSQYIQIMNCIFACQKQGIPLDVCKILGADSTFLQQAANITGGVYIKLDHPSGLLEYLMLTFLQDAYTRKFLVAPEQSSVDFRAACFCHKKIVDIGYVCSVCLSIFCSFLPVCSTCRSKFAFTHMSFSGRLGSTGRLRGRGRRMKLSPRSTATPASPNVTTPASNGSNP